MVKITRHECPWCLEQFAGTDKQAMADRRDHIEDNECGLVPGEEQHRHPIVRVELPEWRGGHD